jgi:hypothetical protein
LVLLAEVATTSPQLKPDANAKTDASAKPAGRRKKTGHPQQQKKKTAITKLKNKIEKVRIKKYF